MSQRLHFQRGWTALGALMIAVVVILSLASVSQPVDVPGMDKINHVVAYGALMFWWGMVQPGRRWTWAVVLVLLGIGLELAQAQTGYRTMDRWDAAANSVGVLAALALLFTPLRGSLAWFDRQLANRLDSGTP